VFPVRYDLDSYTPENGVVHSHCRKDIKFYIRVSVDTRGQHASPVKPSDSTSQSDSVVSRELTSEVGV
jgi:hypothetical protein